ncbi:MAG: SlyX family protein [Pseudomonadota bacterium]
MTTEPIKIEERLAHLERLTEDLSEVVARQDAEIATLTRRVEMLMRAEAERQASEGNEPPVADERPPHW